MDLKPLDRPSDQYLWVMDRWLETPDLTVNERTLIKTMSQSLRKGLDDFDQLRRIAVQPAFISTLRSAAAKAMAAGILLDWSEYDQSP
ncbi:hypothetical protein ACCS91_33600 [Rhizobium ruizarguesonis]|uniref:hypothetical protein n=1 Tax=Rhizobium ruizarguesonis TaxID=2081791 RepID=UPI00163AE9A8|nr:hypothetical protein [Rhizobium ruizarguesonis]MBC2806629.1 hypothetical protein [Rhizobium ruizarguesonis]